MGSKFRVLFKTTDALDNAVEDFVASSLCEFEGLDEDELADEKQRLGQVAKDTAERFMKWGEYICIEFDTQTGEAQVIKRG